MPAPKVCHCGSGKLPGIMREAGWCCGECHNDFKRCPGPDQIQETAEQQIERIFRACQHPGSRDSHFRDLTACWQCGNAANAVYRAARKAQLAARPKDCARCGARPHTFIVAGWKLCGRCKTAMMREHHAAAAKAGALAIFATAPLVDTSTWQGGH